MILDEFISVLGFQVENLKGAQRYNQTLKNVQSTLVAVGQRAVENQGKLVSFAQGINQASRSAAAGATRLTAVSTAITAATTKLTTDFASSVIQAGELQEGQIGQLKSVLKTTAEAAGEEYKRIQQFAGETIVDQDKLIDAFVKIKTNGIDPWAGSLQALADTMAATGGDQLKFERITKALTDTFGAGKINAGNMNQFIEAGVPVWNLLADAMGMTVAEVRKLSEDGKLGADAVDTLVSALGKNFAGASEAAAKSAAGIKNNLGDLRNQFLQGVGGEGFFEDYKSLLVSFDKSIRGFLSESDITAQLSDSFSAATVAVSDLFNRLKPEDWERIAAAIVTVVNSIVDVFVDFVNNVQTDDIVGGIEGVGSAFSFASNVLSTAIGYFTKARQVLVDLIGEEAATKVFAGVLIALVFGLGNIAGAVGGLATAAISITKFISALGGFSAASTALLFLAKRIPILLVLGSALRGLWEAFKTFKETGSIVEALIRFAEVFNETIINAVLGLVKWLIKIPAMLIDALTGSNLSQQVSHFFDNVFTWENASAAISKWPAVMGQWIASILSAVVNSQLVVSVTAYLSRVFSWSNIAAVFTSWITHLGGWLLRIMSVLLGFDLIGKVTAFIQTSFAWANVAESFNVWLANMKMWLNRVWDSVVSLFSGLGQWISNWVAAQVAKVADFFNNQIGKVTGYVGGKVDAAKGFFGGVVSKAKGAAAALTGGNNGTKLATAGAGAGGASTQTTIHNNSSRGGDNVTITNKVSQTVSGASAPGAAAKAVGKGTQKALQRNKAYGNLEAGK